MNSRLFVIRIRLNALRSIWLQDEHVKSLVSIPYQLSEWLYQYKVVRVVVKSMEWLWLIYLNLIDELGVGLAMCFGAFLGVPGIIVGLSYFAFMTILPNLARNKFGFR